MLRLVIILLYLGCSIGLLAQADPVAEAIKPNVAAISSRFASNTTEQGFGFVVGERNNKLYLATAGHVVQEDGADPGKENALSIRIRFCGDDRDLVGRILHSSIRPFDFALLEIDKPAGFVWKADCLGTRPVPGLSVAYIGKANTCYIPTTTTRGTVNRAGLDRLLIDIIGLSRGTSGAPVIGPQGIIGMITTADQASADALSLERLRNEITRDEEFPQRFGLQAGVFSTRPVITDPAPSSSTTGLDLQAWRNAKTKATRQAYQDYLSKYPQGQFVTEAREAIQLIDDQEAEKRRRAAEEKQDQDAWDLASEKNKLENYQTYIIQYPQGKYASEARKRRDALLPSPDIAANNLVKIDGGSFTMGCVPSRDGDCGSDETPSNTVTLTGFYLSKYEVTYGQFKTFIEASKYQTDAEKKGYSYVWTGKWEEKKGVTWKCDVAGNLRSSSESQHPVIHVSHNDAVAYCQWLSKQTGKTYRLPTEAEWEYAARGGKQSKGFKYAGSNKIGEVAWYYDNSNQTTHEVGKLQANELGLYDLSGNVWEWCADWYAEDYYKNSPSTNPQGPASGSSSVLRGGSWYVNDFNGRVADRDYGYPDDTNYFIGFRVARNL